MFIDSVSAQDAARICGFKTVAMLDYLQRAGVFVPAERRKGKRRGRGRRYTFRDMLVLRAIAALLENGASVSSLREALREFQSKRWTADEASLQDEDGGILRYLVASGKSILFATSQATLFDLTKRGQMVFSFVIDLDELHADLRARCFKHRQVELPLSTKAS